MSLADLTDADTLLQYWVEQYMYQTFLVCTAQ